MVGRTPGPGADAPVGLLAPCGQRPCGTDDRFLSSVNAGALPVPDRPQKDKKRWSVPPRTAAAYLGQADSPHALSLALSGKYALDPGTLPWQRPCGTDDRFLSSVNAGALPVPDRPQKDKKRSEERRVGKECRSRWSPYH